MVSNLATITCDAITRGYADVMRLFDVNKSDANMRVTMSNDTMWWLCIAFVAVHLSLEFMIPFVRASAAVLMLVIQ